MSRKALKQQRGMFILRPENMTEAGDDAFVNSSNTQACASINQSFYL